MIIINYYYYNDNVNQTLKSRSEVNSRQFEESEILNLSNNEENYGNSSQDLHMSSSSQIPVDSTQSESILEDYNSYPGCLPEFNPVAKPNEIFWSIDSDGVPTIIPTSTITSTYNEIVTWKKNAFLVPYGRTGKDFIDELTSRINDWNIGTDLQHTSLKVVFVFLAVALQKPGRKSKAKDHQVILSKRLEKWKRGEIEGLVREGRMIQDRIGKFKGADPPNKSKVFTKLITN